MRLFDLHCDTIYECYRKGFSLDINPLHTDLTRGGRYAPWGQVFAVWIPDTCRGEAAFDCCCDALHWLRAQVAALTDRVSLVGDTATWDAAANNGRCLAIPAVEGGAALAGKIENLAVLSVLGVRILTLTWNGSNELGHGCGSGCADGLTPFGKAAVREMERLGIVPDVSHLNDAGFWDVAAVTDHPFMASHSLSRAVHDHPRNLTDDQFREIVRRGGVVGLNFCGAHLGEQTFEAIYRHADHFLSLGGERAVALGGDLDGTDLPDDWGGVAVYGNLADYLAKKGWSQVLLERIFFENAANFLYNRL